MRGTPKLENSGIFRVGIIPACAGNTPVPVDSSCNRRDHPRVCGEHLAAYTGEIEELGSSPRVRGTRLVAVDQADDRGIIPACAGNTLAVTGCPFPRRDHPRVCGEHQGRHHGYHRRRGSSPRVRGTLLHSAYTVFHIGIIPACAGNTE